MVKGIKLTTEEYIIRAKEKWGNKFDYSKTNYINAIRKITIICESGHEFEYNPYSHINNNPNNKGGCDKCARLRIKNIAAEKFLEKAQKKHGKIIDYSNFVWIGREKQNTFTCKIHKDFTQRIGDHLKTEFPCPQCREINRQKKLQEKYKKLTPKMIEKFKNIHPNKYSYKKYQYKGRKETSTITCITCRADFEQYTHNHLTGSGCPTCMSKNRGEKQKKNGKRI